MVIKVAYARNHTRRGCGAKMSNCGPLIEPQQRLHTYRLSKVAWQPIVERDVHVLVSITWAKMVCTNIHYIIMLHNYHYRSTNEANCIQNS